MSKLNQFKAVAFSAIAAVATLTGCESQRHYATPEDAVAALTRAADTKDKDEIRCIFGPDTEELESGDPDQDQADIASFRRALGDATEIERHGDDSATLLIGEVRWPFAVPLVRGKDGWHWDTLAGVDELENRRIGRNELMTIEALRTLIAAQTEYASMDRDGDGVREYAQKLLSAPGTHDGLYWASPGGVDPSPIGPVLAGAALRKDEHGNRMPYHGYHYRMLTRQGSAGPGGAMDYMTPQGLTNGWAAIAWPADYDRTGIVSFLVSSGGIIYQADLGEGTEAAAAAVTEFQPSAPWSPVDN